MFYQGPAAVNIRSSPFPHLQVPQPEDDAVAAHLLEQRLPLEGAQAVGVLFHVAPAGRWPYLNISVHGHNRAHVLGQNISMTSLFETPSLYNRTGLRHNKTRISIDTRARSQGLTVPVSVPVNSVGAQPSDFRFALSLKPCNPSTPFFHYSFSFTKPILLLDF